MELDEAKRKKSSKKSSKQSAKEAAGSADAADGEAKPADSGDAKAEPKAAKPECQPELSEFERMKRRHDEREALEAEERRLAELQRRLQVL